MIGFIGCGNMGFALVEGITGGGLRKPQEIMVYDREHTRGDTIGEKLGAAVAANLSSLCQECGQMFLSVKPQEMKSLLLEIKPFLKPEHLLVTVAAGLNIAFYQSYLESEHKIIRLMPNTPCLVGEGMIALCSSSNVTREEERQVVRLLEPLGRVIAMEEKHFDAVTGLSGSGPAYILLVIEALADGGVEAGLSREVALQLAAQTVLGAAKMCLEAGEDPAVLKGKITSPGGTTIAGLLALEEGAVRSSFARAVTAAARRSKEMGKNN